VQITEEYGDEDMQEIATGRSRQLHHPGKCVMMEWKDGNVKFVRIGFLLFFLFSTMTDCFMKMTSLPLGKQCSEHQEDACQRGSSARKESNCRVAKDESKKK